MAKKSVDAIPPSLKKIGLGSLYPVIPEDFSMLLGPRTDLRRPGFGPWILNQ